MSALIIVYLEFSSSTKWRVKSLLHLFTISAHLVLNDSLTETGGVHLKLQDAGNLPSLRWALIEWIFVATLNFFLWRFLLFRYRGLDSGGYLSLLVDCLSVDGEPVLFLLVPLEGPLSASFNLFEAS